MSRVPRPASPLRTARRSTVGLAFTGAILVLLVAAGFVQAVAVTVGFRDFAYDPGQAQRATADSQQSKVWFANGLWYGGFYSSADNSFNIWRLDETDQGWDDSHIEVDARDRVHADYLFDSATNKLYVASTKGPCTSTTNGCNDAIYLYRFTFVPGSPNIGTRYTLDANFPVTIIGGLYDGVAPSEGGAETVTVAKDANRVYVAWTRRTDANAAPSDTWLAYSTNAGQTTWSAPVLMHDGEDGQSNISALVSFGARVGLYITDAHAGMTDDAGLFRVHEAASAGEVWGAPETASASSVDNQANAKADAAGNVYIAIKTRATTPTSAQIRLLKRTTAGAWTSHDVSDVASANVRAQVAIDTEFNGGAGAAFVIMNEAEAASTNGNVYYKIAPLTGGGALTYTLAGKGTALIDSATDNDIEDATTTKQVLNEASGLVVEATDKTSKFYLHNLIPLPAAADNAGPVGTVVINGNPTPDATKVTGVNLAISATDPNGVVSMNIINSPDGTTCPTSGSPALLVGGTPEAYATAKAWTLSGGDAVKRVCIQFLDHPLVGAGNWSVPVSDTIRLDTTGPAGNVIINGGAPTTPIANVSLDVTATDVSNVANVRISNSGTVDGGGVLVTGETRVYGATQPWTLLPGDNQLKTVYVQWQDGLGTWSAVDSDTITLDTDDTTYTAVTPIRMLDSRSNNPGGVTSFSHGVPQSFQITGRTVDGILIPTNAVAITGNLTVTGQGAAGFVSLGPDVAPIPTTSSINFPKGDTRGNGLFVPLDSNGKLEATYRASGSNPGSKKVNLILDVTGYFVVGDTGNEYFPVTPARFLDTRGTSILNPSVPRSFQVGGRTVGGTTIPNGAVAITGNLSVTGQTKGGYLSLTPTSNNNPSVATLNFPVGDTRGNNFTAKLGPTGLLYVVYKGSGKAHAILDVTGYFLDNPSGLSYVPLAPERSVDTRFDVGITNKLQMGTPKSWNVRVGGVGGDAEAFTGNVTVVGPSRGGFVSVTPNPDATPDTSTINFPKGDTRGNGLAAPTNATGQSSAVFKASGSGSTDFIVDVTGYFH